VRAWIVAGLLAASTGLVACGGNDHGPRDQVAAYIKHANAIQRAYAPQLKRANAAYVSFSRSQGSDDSAVAALTGARGDVRRVRARLRSLHPPAQARALHARLLRVFDMNVYFADETARLAAYQRDSQGATAPLAGIDRRLRSDLRTARAPKAQERALARFAAGLGVALRRLGALGVPRVLAPQHEAQVRRLTSIRRLAVELRTALRKQQANRVARLVKAFRGNGRAPAPSTPLTRRALADYNRRYRALAQANADLAREQARLDRSLD
jgi:hypothetical protein